MVVFAQSYVPINGTGVVFYLGKTGSLTGILLWGMPSSKKEEGGGVESLDQSLGDMVDRAKMMLLRAAEDRQLFPYDMNSRY